VRLVDIEKGAKLSVVEGEARTPRIGPWSPNPNRGSRSPEIETAAIYAVAEQKD
jgi:hypothetical protein